MIKTTVCNNCSKPGHLFHQCKLPITSYGIILFRITKDSKIQYLMIRRKDTFGYIDFIRGKYQQINIEHLQKTIDEMTVLEKDRILTKNFDTLWKLMWGENNKTQYKNEEMISSKKFESITAGVIAPFCMSNTENVSPSSLKSHPKVTHPKVSHPKVGGSNEKLCKSDSLVTLSSLVENSSTSWQEPEWEFPKGRRNGQEKDLICALREFEEETGISANSVTVIDNILPFDEYYIGSNHKQYKHKYFLAYMHNDIDCHMQNFQTTEVSKLEWKSIDECLQSIRPYNLEKKRIIQNINEIVKTHSLFTI